MVNPVQRGSFAMMTRKENIQLLQRQGSTVIYSSTEGMNRYERRKMAAIKRSAKRDEIMVRSREKDIFFDD